MKNSYLVPQQVPEYVLAQYPAFVEFITAYYQWLETYYTTAKLENLLDIDNTLNEFVQYFRKELDVFDILAKSDNRFYLKNIKQLYKAKGSEAAFKFFFNVVYNKQCDISYPWDRVLKLSDGKWNQETTLFINVVKGTPDLIVGKTIIVETATEKYSVDIERYETVEVINDAGLPIIHTSVYQFFVNKDFYDKIPNNVYISYGVDFVGYTTTTSKNITIYKKGMGFRIGELYTINDSIGSGTVIKITKIDNIGGLEEYQIIKFGTGYIDSSSILLIPHSKKSVQLGNISTTTGNSITTIDYYDSFVEKGQIIKYDYNLDNGVDNNGPAISESYAGVVLKGFYTDNTDYVNIDQLYVAVLIISAGTVAKYPGYYHNNDGFLSNSMYLQDNFYYQVYSYEITVEKQIKDYKQILKKTLHPAGYMLFGNYDITNTIEINVELENLDYEKINILSDQVGTLDDVYNINVNKDIIEPVNINETIVKTFIKSGINDNVILTDEGYIFKTSDTYVDVLYIDNDYFEFNHQTF